MNWVSALYDLYEKNKEIAGKEVLIGDSGDTKKLILLPVSHLTVAAQIEVTVDEYGNFIGAGTVAKEDALTVIPVTEYSGSRTSSPVPHPLCDNLKYLSGDYMELIHIKQKEGKDKEKNIGDEYHKPYMEALEKWCSSEFSHLKAVAILKYLQKSTLIHDLIACGVLLPDKDGLISEDVKIQNISQIDSFVRFRVESICQNSSEEVLSDKTGKFKPEVWLDQTLQQSFIDYYRSSANRRGLCYLTGEITQIGELHPKKIRNEGDGAKLISANDTVNYTYRGRFCDKTEAFSIGYEASQKAHNALKWIIRKQGYTRDGLCVVVWESDLKPIISIFDDAADFDSRYSAEEDEIEQKYNTNQTCAKKFIAALNGCKKELGESSNTVIMAFDAATPGRLSITYYKELQSSSYLENIKYWHESGEWLHEKTIQKKQYRFEGMVNIRDIALALYGTEQNGMLALKSDSSGKAPMMVTTVNRLLPCITERKRIPEDMVRTAVIRASSPVSYESYNWKKILSVACSFVKKQRLEKDKENWTMSLNTESHNRDYLYGRLLAVADWIEFLTFEKNDGRQTNAKRYMNAFSQRPFRTWKIIEEKIQPYLNKLSTGQKIYYSKMLDEIQNKFDEKEFSDDSRLDGLYLLGYHCQSYAMRSAKSEETENNDNNDEKENEE